MSVASTSFTSSPAADVAAVPPLHPALVSLRAALDAVRQLEGCLSLIPSSTATLSKPESDTVSSTPQLPASVTAKGLSGSFASPLLFAGGHERDWELLTKQLRCMVDQTHPDGEQPTSEAMAGVAADKNDVNAQDGRAVLLAWDACVATSLDATAASAQPDCVKGEVTRLFSFLRRLADVTLPLNTTTAFADASSGNAPATSGAVASTKLSLKTKAQLQTEDVVEPVLLYGCALASNLASFVAGGKRSRKHTRDAGSDASAEPQKASSKPTIFTWSKEEEEAHLVALGNTIWQFVLAVTRLYRTEKRMLHVVLSVLSNVVSWPTLSIDANTCGFLYQLLPPFYTSYAMVAAWVTMLCNLTAVHGAAAVPALLRLGVVADVQRLSLSVPPSESATTERVVMHSIQLLSNVATFVFKDGGAKTKETAPHE